MRTGKLAGTDTEHPASGTVAIEGHKLSLEGVNITEAPDARVILTKDFDEPTGVRCGSLEGFTGTHEYVIPAGTVAAEYNSVLIWCDEFSVPIGKAELS
jgi:hypothetical protein